MAARPIREVQGLNIIYKHINSDKTENGGLEPIDYFAVENAKDLANAEANHPWILNKKLVCKVDQLVKRRAKSGLIKVNVDWSEAKEFINQHLGKEIKVGEASGVLHNFIVEPFIPHEQSEEAYICIYSKRDHDAILFTHEGGIDIGNVEDKAKTLIVKVGEEDALNPTVIVENLLEGLDKSKHVRVSNFILALYEAYRRQYFTYLEVNPLVITDTAIYMLDFAAKLDSAADYIFQADRANLEYPPPFGRDATEEEAKIREMDSKTGASLKLTILNESGRIWTLVAGGGASVIFADTIVELGGVKELANYGEYSGGPNEEQTYGYARTVIDLMCKHQHPDGKILIIGGGIANFTNVADTFKGLIRAIREAKTKLRENNTQIFVRRGGPNHLEGLRLMRELGGQIDLPIHVYGPETHMTAIVAMALGQEPIEDPKPTEVSTANFSLPSMSWDTLTPRTPQPEKIPVVTASPGEGGSVNDLFTKKTRSIIYGRQFKACQGMLDFDYACTREQPSVACIVDPFNSAPRKDFYWGSKQLFVPIYKTLKEACEKHKDVDVLVNFASLRSAYDVTLEAIKIDQLRTIAIIAEGIPENMTRTLNKKAKDKGVVIIGPATVGGIKPGCFRIGNTGGMMDNIIRSKLYRPGSVAYVSRSGGMSNELNNIINIHTNGVFEGVAIGGDRYPGTTFMDHLLRYHDDPEVKMLVLLGEVGGIEEYECCEALKNGRIKKPMVAWCIGTCSDMFTTDVQFGHAGASAGGEAETATAKNKALSAAGAMVPESFNTFGKKIGEVYEDLVKKGVIVPQPEVPPPPVPMDYAWAREVGLIRRPATFMTSITDERGDELMYSGVRISEIVRDNKGIGGVLGLLWFQRQLPDYFCKFLELCLIVTADHGPAVSGAHNTIVAARAGKDLVSSLASGLLTIGPRFGGALNAAAEQFSAAYDANKTPQEFVVEMKKKNEYIMGIGHRVKSLENPDARVTIVKDFVRTQFPKCPLFEFALDVEQITTAKRSNLILNVDGAIAVAFVDLLRESGQFSREEADRYIHMGILNAIFVLGRTTGFIGHYVDQCRLDQGLYRHPWDDINYIMPH